MPIPNSIDDIIDIILAHEGGYVNHPNDKGKRTQYGISEVYHPEAWADGKVTQDEARTIYKQRYVMMPHFDQIIDPHLQTQLVDFGVNIGPQLAIMKLQTILGVDVDGVIGPQTLTAIAATDPKQVGNKLVIERAKMVGRIVTRDKSQIPFISGWLNRIFSFFRF